MARRYVADGAMSQATVSSVSWTPAVPRQAGVRDLVDWIAGRRRCRSTLDGASLPGSVVTRGLSGSPGWSPSGTGAVSGGDLGEAGSEGGVMSAGDRLDGVCQLGEAAGHGSIRDFL